MPTEPPDDGYWFTPSPGRHQRDPADQSPGQQHQAAPAADAYGQTGSHGQSYGQATAYGQAYGHATVPTPASYQPPAAYQSPAPHQPPTPYQPPASYQPAAAPPQPTPAAAPVTVPQPAPAQPVRQPTGEYPTQRPFPGAAQPTRRPVATGAYPQVGRGPGNGGPGRPPGDGHGHGHGHSHASPGDFAVSRRTRAIVQWILIPCAIATAVAFVLLWPNRPSSPAVGGGEEARSYGQVTKITEVPCPEGLPAPCGTAEVRVGSGQGAGQTVTVRLPQGTGSPHLSVGDDVVLGFATDPGSDEGRYDVIDEQRGQDLMVMVAICAIVVIAFGRLRGMTALIGLAVSFAILLFFILPAILDGASPLLVAIVGSAAIMFAVLYLTHGFSVHTSVAVLGTLASLVLTGLLGALFTITTSLSGFADETSLYLSIMNTNIDFRGLLLAGIIIGALGVLDDVTVTQATTVAELSRGATSRLELYRSAIRIGRAHVASAVNTIVLAYAGAALPLLLLVTASGQDVSDVLTSQLLAEEIVRAAVGTLGLVAAVPITTALGALVADIRSHRAEPRPEGRPDGRPDHRPDGRPDPRRQEHRHQPDHWAEAVTGR